MNSVFKEYDIRGLYGKEINELLFYKIGLSLKNFNIKRIVTGRDGRLSSKSLGASLIKGMIDGGIDVIDAGEVTSPMLDFYCHKNKVMGAMITASHNPKEYNGIKFSDKNGIQLDRNSFLRLIEAHVNKKTEKSNIISKVTKKSILEGYSKNLIRIFKNKFKKRLKVIFDCSNGVGGIPLIKTIKSFNINPIIINQKVDGRFPVHEPDQTKAENLRVLIKEVRKQKADIGIMFDGDADRCAFVDEEGNIAPIDLVFLLLALEEIKRKNGKILFDLRYSRVVRETLWGVGATPVIMRVGNPFYKKVLHHDKHALMGGEYSGHIMYKENFGIDDALFASLKLINFLSNQDKKLSELLKGYKKYYTTGEISIKVINAEKQIRKIESFYKDFKKSHLDGLSVDLGKVWFVVRPSNTEPLIRFVVEGKDENLVNNQKEVLLKLIEND